MGLCVTPKKLEYKYYKGKVEKGKENIMEHQERELKCELKREKERERKCELKRKKKLISQM